MNNNMNTNTQPRQRSEKQKEGRRRQCDDEWDDDCDYYGRYNFIVCDDEFRSSDKDFNELSTKMAQIFTAQNSNSIPSNLKTYKFTLLDEFIAKTPPTEEIRQFQISGKDLYYGKNYITQ
jgi:hypothetical protein